MVAKVNQYEKAIAQWLREYAEERTSPSVEYQFIQDSSSKNYQVVRTGWDGTDFMYLIVFHFQIKENGKVWVWANHTDIDLAAAFHKMAIEDQDIVPAFQPPYLRKYSGYAEA